MLFICCCFRVNVTKCLHGVRVSAGRRDEVLHGVGVSGSACRIITWGGSL